MSKLVINHEYIPRIGRRGKIMSAPFKLTILINCKFNCKQKATLKYPEYRRMPRDCAKLVRYHILHSMFPENPNPVIWTCSDVPINIVGEMIGEGKLKQSEVDVVYDGKTYQYDDKGYLDGDWPYGVFSSRPEDKYGV